MPTAVNDAMVLERDIWFRIESPQVNVEIVRVAVQIYATRRVRVPEFVAPIPAFAGEELLSRGRTELVRVVGMTARDVAKHAHGGRRRRHSRMPF